MPICQTGSGGIQLDVILAEGDHYRHIGEIAGMLGGSYSCSFIEYNMLINGSMPVIVEEGSIGTEIGELIKKKANVPIKYLKSHTADGKVTWH